MTTWADVRAMCTDKLGSSDEARRIVEQAVEQVPGNAGRPWPITMSIPAPQHGIEAAAAMVQRRLTGEPLQYVLGCWGFRTLNLHIDSRVLIPRPETEQVTQAAFELIAGVENPRVVDLGTGSGAIALSIAAEHPTARVVATDASAEALEVARSNYERLALQRVEFRHGSWFDALDATEQGTFDLIVSNPPYVGESDELEPVVVDWEPKSALFAGPDGLDDLTRIVMQASSWLKPNGVLIVELAPTQADAIARLALANGFRTAEIGIDLAGRKRWLTARL